MADKWAGPYDYDWPEEQQRFAVQLREGLRDRLIDSLLPCFSQFHNWGNIPQEEWDKGMEEYYKDRSQKAKIAKMVEDIFNNSHAMKFQFEIDEIREKNK